MIPKVIHYCWFGGNAKPQSVINCINSWKKFLPDYEIKEWNESNFDLNFLPYVKEAYQMKKWAFVSDVARIKVIYDNGGIYFDTDVEVIKSFDDLLNQNFFLGLEDNCRIASGLGFGAEKGSLVMKEMLDEYNNEHFILEGGKINPKVCPVFNTDALVRMGLDFKPGLIEFMGGTIYPEEYFSPLGMKDGKLRITDNTYSIHHYDNSWMTSKQKLKKKVLRKFGKYIRPIYYLLKGKQE